MINSVRDKVIFLIVSFAPWFSHFIYLPILTPHIELMGGKYTFIGIVLSSYGLMQFIFRLPIGICSDLFKLRRPFIVTGMLISTASCLLFALTDSLGWVLIARSLAGIAAATWVVFTVLYSSYFVDREVHRAMSSISFVVVLAQLLGMSVSGIIVNEWGWHAPFWIGGITSLLAAILSFFIYEVKEENARAPVKVIDLTSVIKEPMLIKVSMLSILAHSMIFTTTFGFIPAYALKIGLTASEISLLVFTFMIPHAIATLFMGKLIVPLLGKWKTLNIAFFASALITLLTPFIESKGLLMVIQALNGFSLGIVFPMLLGLAIETIPHEKRATAMGVYQALYAIGMFSGPFIAGVLNTKFGLAAGFYFTGIVGFIASILIITWSRKETDALKKHYEMST
ncbi:MFS transporter [Bacillus sp. SA1-12]|uniref:MFS transporter n=1 Tax=Bacillus sp. SA1-12 TaxID=1455638 RepID=UPI0006271035|nr:MFS transporter [Bacillus sp. SA1-12]KKI89866.1 MFS transporter [Bacillus sp. SA1-12]